MRGARPIEVVSVGFVALGVLLPVVVPWVVGPSEWARTTQLAVGIAGGSIAGHWVAQYGLARFALRRAERWAVVASAAGLLAWSAVGTFATLAAGAPLAWLLPIAVPVAIVGPLLAFEWRLTPRTSAPRDPRRSIDADRASPIRTPARFAAAASALGIGSGIAIAFAGGSTLFAPWFGGLADAHFGGAAVPAGARASALAWFPIVGAAVAAQFAILVAIARVAIARGERWAIGVSAVSVLAWFVVDSGWSLASGGAFNVGMVNVSTLVLSLPPLVWAARASRSTLAT